MTDAGAVAAAFVAPICHRNSRAYVKPQVFPFPADTNGKAATGRTAGASDGSTHMTDGNFRKHIAKPWPLAKLGAHLANEKKNERCL
jgi:hypothetical protein